MRYSDDAYIIERGGRRSRRRGGGAGRAAGILIAVLLLLTAVICLLVVLLPRAGSKSVAAPTTAGKTYYFLCTAETEDRTQALLSAHNAMERGGAGYLYNDGKYRIIAAVYSRESDVKTLVTVNVDSFYFSLSLPGGDYKQEDRAVINYLTGEWFDTVSTASTELDRGNLSEAAAEYAVARATGKLRDLAYKATEKLKSSILSCAYSQPNTQSVLSYIRYINVQFVLCVYSALV